MAGQIPLRVLLVEDDAGDARIFLHYASALTDYDARVDHATDVQQALLRASESRYDLVFLDMHLGDHTNGVEVLDGLRQAGLDVPVIVLTGAADVQSATEMMKSGAADYLVKDAFSTQVMDRAVRNALAMHTAYVERQEAEEARRESEELFQLLVENALDGINICEFDPVTHKRRLLFANDRYFQMSGYSREQLASAEDLNELIVLHHSMEERRYHYQCIVKGIPFTGSASWKRPDGRQNVHEWSTVSIKKGDKYWIIGIDRDATERRQAEEALRTSENRYRELVEHANSIILEMDPDGRITFFNRFAESFFGYSRQEIIGQNMVGTIVPQELGDVIRNIGRSPQKYSVNENVNVTRDGRRVYVAWTNWPVTDAQGNVLGIVCVGNDVTQRKEAELELVRERTFCNAVIDTAGALIVVLDNQGRIVRFNSACQKLTGYTFEELRGRSLIETLVPAEEKDVVQEVLGGLMEPGSSSTHENHWLTKTGEKRLIVWNNTNVPAEDGNVRWVIGTGLDVTEHRKLEEHLRQAAKLEAVGMLAGGVAHDFNNLLTAILGYVDLNLLQIPRGSQLREDMKQVRAAAKRAAELTRQLLAFGRQQAAGTELLNLNYIVRDVQNMLRRLIEENIELRFVLSDKLLMIKADRTQIEQVLMNLAVNARDAMRDGGVLTVETAVAELDGEYVRTHPGVTEGQYAMLAVRDTGVGMTPEVQKKMFDPFFTTKEVGQGTGLGLSMVYGIVQQHGGTIECESRPDWGTRFSVYLPLAEQQETTTDQDSSFTELPALKKTVLVVEDEDEVRDLVVKALQTCGYAVMTASNGVEGLKLARSHDGPIDLLLTDVVMPKMNGPELAQSVRQLQPDIKLMFMSGYPDSVADVLPGVPMVRKPFTLKVLAQAVEQIFAEDRA
jgi:PAS domain S-box-containing protein